MKKISILLLISFLFFGMNGIAQQSITVLKATATPPVIDGNLNDKNWDEVFDLEFKNSKNSNFSASITYDSEYLYVACKNLTDVNGIRHHAEILINTGEPNTSWNANCHWYHSSHTSCSSKGAYYMWKNCSDQHPDWKANNFPFTNGNNHMEFKISLATLGIEPQKGTEFQLAVKISDSGTLHHYWPNVAAIEDPSIWRVVSF